MFLNFYNEFYVNSHKYRKGDFSYIENRFRRYRTETEPSIPKNKILDIFFVKKIMNKRKLAYYFIPTVFKASLLKQFPSLYNVFSIRPSFAAENCSKTKKDFGGSRLTFLLKKR